MDHRVRFLPSGRSVRVSDGSTLLDAAREVELPVASACDASGICSRCGLEVLEGGEALGTEDEQDRERKRRNRIDPDLRLSCRTRVVCDLVVTAPYW